MPPNTAVCRLCLSFDVRMVKLSGTPLQGVYEKIADTALHSMGRPVAACYMCHAQLVKCYNLMRKTAAAENVLQDLLTRCCKVTVKSLSGVDRHATGLHGILSVSRPIIVVIENPPATAGVQSDVKSQGSPDTEADDDDEESDSDEDDIIINQQDPVTNIGRNTQALDASNIADESSDGDSSLSDQPSDVCGQPPDTQKDKHEHLGRVRPAPSCDTSEQVIISSDDEDTNDNRNSQVPISSTSKHNATSTNKPTDFCFFCETRVFNFGEHVLRTHTAEPEVQTILSYPERSSFRKYLFNDLLKKGNYITNVIYKPKETEEYFQCEKCLGKYSNNLFTRHNEICQVSNTTQADKQISKTAQQPMVVNTQNKSEKEQISTTAQQTQHPDSQVIISEPGETQIIKKKRGRRPKQRLPETTQIERRISQSAQETPVQCKRGRPSKQNLLEIKNQISESAEVPKRRGRKPKHHKSIIMETQKQQISTTSQIETQRIAFHPQFDPQNQISKISQIETPRISFHPQFDPQNQISETAQIKTPVMPKATLLSTQKFVANKILKNKKKMKRALWTPEQKELVLNYFSENIKNKKLPNFMECASLQILHANVLHNKGPNKIRSYVHSVYRNRISQFETQIIPIHPQFDPKNQITKTAQIKTPAMPKSSLISNQKFVANKILKKKIMKRVLWTPEQKELVLNSFSEHIKNKKLPKVMECASLHILHADVLHNKDPNKIRAFVHNELYRNRKGDLFLNAGVSQIDDPQNQITKISQFETQRIPIHPQFDPKNQISETAHIKTLVMPKSSLISTQKFVANKIRKNRKKRKPIPWTPEQKQLVLNSFSEHIKNKKLPNVMECESFYIKHDGVLHNKDPMKIKFFVQNELNRNRKTDRFLNAEVSETEESSGFKDM